MPHYKYSTWVYAMIFASIYINSSSGQSVDTAKISLKQRVLQGVVIVEATLGGGIQKIGSGFVIESDGSIITNHHVVNKAISVHVLFSDEPEKRYPCGWVDHDLINDLVILRFIDERPNALHPLTLVENADDHPPKETRIILFGHPTEHAETIRWTTKEGRIEDATRVIKGVHVYLSDMPAFQGFSGGPVVGSVNQFAQGQVLGVLISGFGDGSPAVNFIVPHRYIRELVDISQGKMLRNFDGADYPLDDRTGLYATHFSYQGPPSDTRKGIQQDPRSNSRGLAKQSRLLELMKRDPNFGGGVSIREVEQAIKDSNLVEFYNPTYRFGFFIPQGASVTESYDERTATLTCLVKTPKSEKILKIYARKVDRLDRPDGASLLNRAEQLSRWYFEKVLGLRLVPTIDPIMGPVPLVPPPVGQPGDMVQVGMAPPLVHPQHEEVLVEFVYHEFQPNGGGMVADYGVCRDVFVAAHFDFTMPQADVQGGPPGLFGGPGAPPQDFLEKYAIIETLYFDTDQ